MQVETSVRVPDAAHVVHFYDADDDLVTAVGSYLSRSVLDGDNVIVIATPAHRAAFEAALDAANVDMGRARARGRLVVLDAAQTLSGFMVDDWPDTAAFEASVGELVRSRSRGGGDVRAYGEMVALLWEAGNVTGAIELERLWNALGEQLPFSLLCAYPSRLVGRRCSDQSFLELCDLHSEVVAGAPQPDDAEVTRRFAATTDSIRAARSFVADQLRDWGTSGTIDDALLVVTELAANAVEHAGADFTVGLSRGEGRIRVEVGDGAATTPDLRDPNPSTPGGRGLRIVDALARRWGHTPVAGGKLVWVELADHGAPEAMGRP